MALINIAMRDRGHKGCAKVNRAVDIGSKTEIWRCHPSANEDSTSRPRAGDVEHFVTKSSRGDTLTCVSEDSLANASFSKRP